MKPVKTLVFAILAGMSISIGGIAFLSIESKVVGAIFFTVGLFAVCTFSLNLFTGKVCYVFDNDHSYLISLAVIWVGNLLGAMLVGLLMKLTRVGPALMERAKVLADTKLSDSAISVFILAIFCNILIFIAVDGYKNNPHVIGKYLSIFFGVTVFIICGFEHCVANMFYFSMAGAWSPKTVLWIIIMSLGNAVGGIIIPLCRKKLA